MKRYFLTGIVVLIPVVITVWVLRLVITSLDQIFDILPIAWRPETLVGLHIPGLGVLVALLIVILTGAVATNFLGRKLLDMLDDILGKIPLVKSIYSGVKQVSDTLFSSSGQAFRQVLLVRYPHNDVWTIAFQTGVPTQSIAREFSEPHVNVYVPTTPNPTSGFFLMLPKSQTIELDMSVDMALKYIISMGVVDPTSHTKAAIHSINPSN
ncbi:MAG: hypothetical protein B7Z60_08200 [Ferrovum sp. 37-45-19]|jgi:uncharacterized membrane protein|uniref:DUF502 domain-containing protein n=1 Tax=Ferrovum sp. JA12 TaxID=1356299 RepID=UPI00070313B2|nr:DUF502 domain-containing protein [Ferrovum sp. JA12]OYV79172.1 MAG: hypothetical protein B7Z65_07140 [Ferrovum sp. 21-44-67]OYV93533.1 MAG: hypothetical protein B7Z60_08200 [Ferrovum sp. 37-45-19]OZB33328.1 MAG: hypothetical protein B7X47_04645 [Ferrovum sp. 34-44-207]HQT81797.1 DUF502 domain-containing protein [Ferrovaceae bacterium]KRH79625.1 hypothetical protein FERRO_06970 [Ferrovum sp. JA12]